MKAEYEMRPAGFWIRVLATWIDSLVVYCFCSVLFYVLLMIGPHYFPFNFAFITTYLIYTLVATVFLGTTAGKWFIGIQVIPNAHRGEKPLLFLRESLFKIISILLFGIGLFWIAINRKKNAWHDYFACTRVWDIGTANLNYGSRIVASITLFTAVTWYLTGIVRPIVTANRNTIDASNRKLAFLFRPPDSVESAPELNLTTFQDWLKHNSQPAKQYAIEMARTHQVTLFGEEHLDAGAVNFFTSLIPGLYHQAGVRVLALEIVPSSCNRQLSELIDSNVYNYELALEIARKNVWRSWGYEEYWNILYVVWQLNRQLPPQAEKLKVIGLEGNWTMPDISLLGISQDSKGDSPFVEKFRVFSALNDLPEVVFRDNLMAQKIEQLAFDQHKKTVVYIGFEHTMINYARCVVGKEKIVPVKIVVGLLLSQKHPGEIWQIKLNTNLAVSRKNATGSLNSFFDSTFAVAGYGLGFTVRGSPFEKIRDEFCDYFSGLPGSCFGDICQGLIALNPSYENAKCHWMSGYFSDIMIMENKPLYDFQLRLLTGEEQNSKKNIDYSNAAELNKLFQKLN
ncbi:MAG TPA: RDD family protein [Cyclobacteriaceae bacterium]|nr:RDD family protein [Cyclobacteriaceae bacterium]HMV08122.1 RDD family protein [Cyclobacteriaceae bacterium]HMV88336.1 RDD family protein [Cyclobacteriaceae bacterium]HMX00763.1 RDD family protein [Cyclobacteriaceae bacterium]HMX49362.1 RDD family protein [Cyclobacteriaceae bacterium]